VTGDAGGRVTLWDARTGRRLRLLARHGDRVLDVTFSSDGKFVASASRDTTAQLVHVGGGAASVLRGHGNAVDSVAFSPTGNLVLTTSFDGTARLWEVSTGVQLAAFPATSGAAFGPKNTVVTATQSALQVYACDVCRPVKQLVKLATTHVTRPLTHDERVRYLK
jgi:WD40 repeat protein